MNTYSVAGLSIWVESDEAWIADAFDRQFSGSHLKPSTRNGAPSTTIRIFDSRPPALPFGLESFAVAEGGRCFTDGSVYHIAHNGSLVSIDCKAPATVKVWLGASALSGAALARLFFTAAAAAVRRCNLYELHAGCIVEPTSGKGVVLIGPSGSGKSTLTAQLAAAGWGYLSDDSLLLRTQRELPEVHALRRIFAVTEQAIDAGGLLELENGLGAPMALDPAKRRFDPFEAFPNQFVESCAPSVVVFPSVGNVTESAAERLTQAEAMSELIGLCPWASYDRVAAHGYLGALSALARACAAYRLHLGLDVFGDTVRASGLLRSLL
ncbi:MAG TPA: hypothetical protein VNG71_13875 [Pyrinomonadaceae bacterium]|nr:hypothetical protein [Pyrinomonadaceae bacterium]